MTVDEDRPHTAEHSRFRRGVFLTSSGTFINVALLFLETIIIVRMLPPGAYGDYVLLVVVVNFLVAIVDIGFKTTVTKMTAGKSPGEQARVTGNAFALRFAAISLVAGVVWLGQYLFQPLLAPSQGLLSYIVYIPLMVAVASTDELLGAVLQGFQRYRNMVVALACRSVLRVCLTLLFLLLLHLAALGLIYSWILSYAISIAYQLLVLPVSPRPAYQRRLMGKMLRFGFPLHLTRLLWFMFARVNVMLLGALAGPVAVAYYEVANKIPEALQRLSESYIAVFFPTVAALSAAGKSLQAQRIVNHSLSLASFSSALLAIIAVSFSRQITALLFSADYLPSSPVFSLLMVAFQMTFMLSLMGYTLTCIGRPQLSLYKDLLRTLLNVVGNLLLIPVLGFVGPAYATLAAGYVTNPVATWFLRRSRVEVNVTPYAKQTVLLLLCVALYWWLQPTQTIYCIAIIVLFVALNGAFSTIPTESLCLILPSNVAHRLGARKESQVYGR